MRRFICIAATAFFALSPGIHAGPWQKSIDANLTMTQNAYSDNWSGGVQFELALRA